jgi:hypothetical protein
MTDSSAWRATCNRFADANTLYKDEIGTLCDALRKACVRVENIENENAAAKHLVTSYISKIIASDETQDRDLRMLAEWAGFDWPAEEPSNEPTPDAPTPLAPAAQPSSVRDDEPEAYFPSVPEAGVPPGDTGP